MPGWCGPRLAEPHPTVPVMLCAFPMWSAHALAAPCYSAFGDKSFGPTENGPTRTVELRGQIFWGGHLSPPHIAMPKSIGHGKLYAALSSPRRSAWAISPLQTVVTKAGSSA